MLVNKISMNKAGSLLESQQTVPNMVKNWLLNQTNGKQNEISLTTMILKQIKGIFGINKRKKLCQTKQRIEILSRAISFIGNSVLRMHRNGEKKEYSSSTSSLLCGKSRSASSSSSSINIDSLHFSLFLFDNRDLL